MENKNPWLTIWTRPKATITHVVAENPNRSLWWLASIYGFSSLLNFFQSMEAGRHLGLAGILILSLIIAPIYGYITFSIWSWFVFWTGKVFKGLGTFKTVRASYAWSCVPALVNIPLWLIIIARFGHRIFTRFPESHQLPAAQVIFLFVILIAKVILAIWSLVIFINALAAVQKYSILRSILNILLAAVVFGVILFILWTLLLFTIGRVATGPFLFWKPF